MLDTCLEELPFEDKLSLREWLLAGCPDGALLLNTIELRYEADRGTIRLRSLLTTDAIDGLELKLAVFLARVAHATGDIPLHGSEDARAVAVAGYIALLLGPDRRRLRDQLPELTQGSRRIHIDRLTFFYDPDRTTVRLTVHGEQDLVDMIELSLGRFIAVAREVLSDAPAA